MSDFDPEDSDAKESLADRTKRRNAETEIRMTMPFTLDVTAQQAAAMISRISGKFRSGLPSEIGQSSRVLLPKVPAPVKLASAESVVHVYNVGPWEHKAMLGSWGNVLVPPCPLGDTYSKAEPIPGVFIEPLLMSEVQMENHYTDGMEVAKEVLGTYNVSMLPYGMFIGSRRGPKATPLKKELAAARKLLREKCAELVKEGNRCYKSTPGSHGHKMYRIGSHHQLAAKYLKRKVKWME